MRKLALGVHRVAVTGADFEPRRLFPGVGSGGAAAGQSEPGGARANGTK
jgi:hypothetical protein